MNEDTLQERFVIPWLIERGHEIQAQYVVIGKPPNEQEADLITFFQGKLWIWELKRDLEFPNLQTAIGQLVIQQISCVGVEQLAIGLPMNAINKKINIDLVEHLRNKHGIEIVLIPTAYSDMDVEKIIIRSRECLPALGINDPPIMPVSPKD